MGITAIRKVSAWTTSDGKPFTVRAEAVAHEAYLNLKRLMGEEFGGYDWNAESILNAVSDKSDAFAEALEDLVKARKRLADVRAGAADEDGQASLGV